MALIAHGERYESVEAARARVTELEALNAQYGPSDGRATEIDLIEEAIKAHAPEGVTRRPRSEFRTIPNSRNATPVHRPDGSTVWRARTGPVTATGEGRIGFLWSLGKDSRAEHKDGTVLRAKTGYAAYQMLKDYHDGRIDSLGRPTQD